MKPTFLASGVILVLCMAAQIDLSRAQVRQAWVARFGMGAGVADIATSMATDPAGNVYVTGRTETTNTPYTTEYLTVKFGPDGRVRWSARYRNASVGNNNARVLCLDSNGNCYVTGSCENESGRLQVVTVKYDSSGQELWVARYAERTLSFPYDLKVDVAGNVYVAGYRMETNGASLVAAYLTLKINANGHLDWAREYPGARAYGVAADADGNVFVTGSAGSYDIATLKYASDGTLQWSRSYDTSGMPAWSESGYALVVDSTGNLYMTGGGNPGFITLKYNNTGTQLWQKTVPSEGSLSEAHYLALDNGGNIIIGGWAPLQSESMEWGLAKYTAAGALQWTRSGHLMARRDDYLRGMVVGPDDSIYACAESVTNDFYHSVVVTVKYAPTGTELWRRVYQDPFISYASPCGVGLDAAGNVYVAASTSRSTEPGSDYLVIKYEQASAAARLALAGFDNRGLRLNLFALSNLVYTVEASPNLRDWTAIATVTNHTGTVGVTDTEPFAFGQKFYRARQP